MKVNAKVPSRLSTMLTIALVWLQGLALCTTCCRVLLLPRKLGSPRYCAATVFVPMGKEAVVAEALPATRALVLKGTSLAAKMTLPDGVPVAGATALTVAVKVTFEVSVEGF